MVTQIALTDVATDESLSNSEDIVAGREDRLLGERRIDELRKRE